MNVVVDVLSSDDWCNRVALMRGTLGASVLKLQTLLLETGLDGFWVAVLVLTMLNRNNVVLVLL